MFNMKKPCVNCPFRKGAGRSFRLREGRLTEIVNATAFQCHKTVDYSGDEPDAGARPQQCAGLMSVLIKEECPNQIMQIASRMGALDFDQIDGTDTYDSFREMFADHCD